MNANLRNVAHIGGVADELCRKLFPNIIDGVSNAGQTEAVLPEPPTEAQILDYIKTYHRETCPIPFEEAAEYIFGYYTARGWQMSNRRKVYNWHSVVDEWIKNKLYIEAINEPEFDRGETDHENHDREEFVLLSDAEQGGKAKYVFYALPGEYIPTMFDNWLDTGKLTTAWAIEYKSRSEKPNDNEIMRVCLDAVHNWRGCKESELYRLLDIHGFECCQYNCYSNGKFDPSESIITSFTRIYGTDIEVRQYCTRLTKYKKAMSLFNYQGNVFEMINAVDLIKSSLKYPAFVTFISKDNVMSEPPDRELFRLLCAVKSVIGAKQKCALTDCSELAARYYGFHSAKDIPAQLKTKGSEFKKLNHHKVEDMLKRLAKYNVSYFKTGKTGPGGLLVSTTLTSKQLEERYTKSKKGSISIGANN